MDLQTVLVIVGLMIFGIIYGFAKINERKNRFIGGAASIVDSDLNFANNTGVASNQAASHYDDQAVYGESTAQEILDEEIPILDFGDEMGDEAGDEVPILKEIIHAHKYQHKAQHKAQHSEQIRENSHRFGVDNVLIESKTDRIFEQHRPKVMAGKENENEEADEITAAQKAVIAEDINHKHKSANAEKIEPVFNLVDKDNSEIATTPPYQPASLSATYGLANAPTAAPIQDNGELGLQNIEPTMRAENPKLAKGEGSYSQPIRSGAYVYPGVQGFHKVSQIDYWAKITGDKDISRESVLAQYAHAASNIRKPTKIHGVRLPDKSWCNLETASEESRFGDLVVTLQLADAIGPVVEEDIDKFMALIANLSAGTGREFSFITSAENALKQARCIDEFSRRYDTVFVVNIKPLDAEYLDGGSILRYATQLCLEQGEDAFFVRNKSVSAKKGCLYCLADLSDSGKFDFENMKNLKTRGVTFFTRPAVNRSPGAVFSEMVDAAKVFSAKINGVVVAPNSDTLSADDIERIRASIEKVAAEMEAAGLSPGSDEAIRLF